MAVEAKTNAHRDDPYPLVVIGGEPAGIVAARAAARRRIRVALVLPENPETEPPEPSTFLQQIRRTQLRIGRAVVEEPSLEEAVDLFRGTASFSSGQTIFVGGRALRYRKALIVTGAGPALAEVDETTAGECLRTETLSELTETPGRLAVLGSGLEACQWAQAFRRLGSQVHLISRQLAILPAEDPDAAGALCARLERDDVRLHLGCDELSMETTGNLRGILIRRGQRQEKLLVEQVLLCGPRRPNLAELDLDGVGVEHNEQGILVDDRLRTTNRRIFAAGGVCGSGLADPRVARVSAQLAVHNALSFFSRRLGRQVISRCVYTEPVLAQVGLTREEAALRGMEIDTRRIDLDEADESLPPDRREGFIAVYRDRRTAGIVGATVVAADADELIAPLALLMAGKLPPGRLAEAMPGSPSRMELLRQLAERHLGARAASRWSRVLTRCRAWLRR